MSDSPGLRQQTGQNDCRTGKRIGGQWGYLTGPSAAPLSHRPQLLKLSVEHLPVGQDAGTADFGVKFQSYLTAKITP